MLSAVEKGASPIVKGTWAAASWRIKKDDLLPVSCEGMAKAVREPVLLYVEFERESLDGSSTARVSACARLRSE